jgi:hypothetical protein
MYQQRPFIVQVVTGVAMHGRIRKRNQKIPFSSAGDQKTNSKESRQLTLLFDLFHPLGDNNHETWVK